MTLISLRVGDDVIIGEDMTSPIDYRTRAGAFGGNLKEEKVVRLRTFGGDIDDTAIGLFVDEDVDLFFRCVMDMRSVFTMRTVLGDGRGFNIFKFTSGRTGAASDFGSSSKLWRADSAEWERFWEFSW